VLIKLDLRDVTDVVKNDEVIDREDLHTLNKLIGLKLVPSWW
jgi:hypothetical protein